MVWATVSAIAWSVLLVWGGALLGREYDRLLEWLAQYGRVVTALLAVCLLGVAIRRWRRRPKNSPRRDPPGAALPPSGG